MQQDVRRLDIPVNDVLGIEGLETIDDLAEVFEGLGFGQVASTLLEELLEVTVSAIFEEHVEVSGGSGRCVHTHNVQMLDGLHDVDLTLQKLKELWVGGNLLEGGHLHCYDLGMVVFEEPAVDNTEGTFTQKLGGYDELVDLLVLFGVHVHIF